LYAWNFVYKIQALSTTTKKVLDTEITDNFCGHVDNTVCPGKKKHPRQCAIEMPILNVSW